MHTNRLIDEKSPYLLQHAHNPVDWMSWGEEAFSKARAENKPIFLSIGYSTCHWCHVMERESFESEEIAQTLNRHFVSVKVDREERPDVDRIYMNFIQATTGGGGWPMSVWLTPELKPFYGGTYFPPDDRYGRPGFKRVLEALADAWRTDREGVTRSSDEVVRQLREQSEVGAAREAAPDPGVLERGFFAFRRSFDSRLGGFGTAPKFPRPSVHNFLLRYWARTSNEEALEMVLTTLRAMARGGMHDQLGGGFHRYSVDEFWFVPHFEKMLYDQAQLAISYLEAYQATHETGFATIARGIFDYVLRDMVDPGGGFYSAEDADSIIDPANPREKGEGAFYIWTQAEIEEIAGEPAAKWVCYQCGVEEDGNVRNDPHGEFTGRNILFSAHTIEQTARHFDRDEQEVRAAVLQAERKLLEARSGRPRPHLDDKNLTSWNGLMISAFARGGAILSEKRYEEAARRAADFIRGKLYQAESGRLKRRFRDGEAAIDGFLDDYAFFVQGLLDLYETQFEIADLQRAIALTDKMRELFEDDEQGGFYSTSAGDESLLLRIKEDYDGAEPSGNSIAVLNLLRLAQMTGRPDFERSARKAMAAFASRMHSIGMGVPQMLAAFDFSLSKPRQVILVGDRSAPDTIELRQVLHSSFVPNKIALLVDGGGSRGVLGEMIPAVGGMEALDGKATAYVCEDYACQLPTNDPRQFAELLK